MSAKDKFYYRYGSVERDTGTLSPYILLTPDEHKLIRAALLMMARLSPEYRDAASKLESRIRDV